MTDNEIDDLSDIDYLDDWGQPSMHEQDEWAAPEPGWDFEPELWERQLSDEELELDLHTPPFTREARRVTLAAIEKFLLTGEVVPNPYIEGGIIVHAWLGAIYTDSLEQARSSLDAPDHQGTRADIRSGRLDFAPNERIAELVRRLYEALLGTRGQAMAGEIGARVYVGNDDWAAYLYGQNSTLAGREIAELAALRLPLG